MNRTLKCVRCGAELADGDRFCGECGNRVVALPPESGRLPPVVHAAPRRPPAATVLAVVVGALVIVAAFGLRNRVAMPTPATRAPIARPPAITPAEPETRSVPPPPQPGVTPSTASSEVTVPNFGVFDSVSEMKAVLRHAGLTVAFVAASEPPPSKDKEFKYAGQDPAPDTKVKSGSTVTIAIYQKFGGHDSD